VVIDDEKLIAFYLFALLEEAGHVPILARSQSIVLEDLERCKYDVVLTDLRMPGVSGWEVADWVARHRPGIPVIAVSDALTEARNSDEYDRFAAIVAKSGDGDQLCKVVEEVAARFQSGAL
jgi:DNA-binding NtrC family response regulator